MGMPRSGVGGRGGVVGLEMREPRLERETGEVGRLTVTGTLELRVRLLVEIVLVKVVGEGARNIFDNFKTRSEV